MMKPLRRFEKRLEKMFEGPFTRAFKGGVHPLEIARRLTSEVEDGRVLGMEETLAPNNYQVFLGPQDYERMSGFLDGLGSEMESLIITYANQKGYHLLTRPRLSFQVDDDLREGEFSILVSLDEPARAVAAAGRPAKGAEPVSQERRLGVITVRPGDKAGYSYYLEAGKTRIGRSEENDLVVVDPLASRFHAEIDRLAEGYVLRDLGSTNGTLVRGRRIQERLLEDGDTLVMGKTEMIFGLVDDPRRR